MQEQNRSFSQFSLRSDLLSEHYRIPVAQIAGKMDISERMLFGYRTGKYPISKKAWRKLEQAEREAGLVPAFKEQFQAASGEEATRLLESATKKELFSVMPPEVRQLLMEGSLEKMNMRMVDLILAADGLATTAKDFLEKPQSKQARADVIFFIKKIQADFRPARDLWKEIYESLKQRFLGK